MLVRFKHGKTTFEVVTNEGAAMKFRDGKISMDEVLVAEEIFTNYSKRERASADQLKAAFESDDLRLCLQKILTKGEVQLSVAERKAKVDQKRAEIINFLHKYYVDPRTKLPIPASRFESGLTQIKARIDPDTPAERQVQDFLPKLTSLIPMRKMTIDGTLTIPHQYLGAAGGIISQYLTVTREQYNSQGCVMEVQAVPGEYDRVMQELTRVTKGDFTLDVAASSAAPAPAPPPSSQGKGKSKRK